MSIMDKIFGTAPKPADPTAAAGNTQIPTAQTVIKSDGSVPAIPATNEVKSPFDNYQKLWEPAGEGQSTGIPSAVPSFALKPEELRKTAEQIDFTKDVSSSELKEVFGDNINETALRTLLNKTSRSGFENTFAAGAKTIESAMTIQHGKLTKETIPEMLRRQEAARLNATSSELFTNPAVAPMLKALENQLADKYPTATAEQIRDHALTMFDGIAQTHAKSRGMVMEKAPDRTSQPVETDWMNWAAE